MRQGPSEMTMSDIVIEVLKFRPPNDGKPAWCDRSKAAEGLELRHRDPAFELWEETREGPYKGLSSFLCWAWYYNPRSPQSPSCEGDLGRAERSRICASRRGLACRGPQARRNGEMSDYNPSP